MAENASVYQIRLMEDESMREDGPLNRAYSDFREQREEQLLRELQPRPQEEVALLVGQRGIYLNIVVRAKAEMGELESQGIFDLAA